MVVFFDIDGTLVDNETQVIPASAVRAVEQLGKNGHLAVVNTGRPYAHIDPRIREMAFGGWVCGCGMEIRLNGTWLTRHAPTGEVCRFVRDAVRDCGMQALYEPGEGAIYLDGAFSRHPNIQEEARQMAAKGFAVRELAEDTQYLKVVAFEWPGCHREEFIRRVAPYYDCIDRGNTMLELVLKGCSKAGGMVQLLEHLGVAREDTLAIGDSTNDLPMFSVAGHTACMGNGMAELKAKAEYITGTVLEDGIETALRHFGLV